MYVAVPFPELATVAVREIGWPACGDAGVTEVVVVVEAVATVSFKNI